MKQETLHTLITAKVLFDKAEDLCTVDDKFIASAGLLVLQDAVELVFYSCLMELESELEAFDTFDQLIGELKKLGKPVANSQTLKALNKQRVIIKHYGQIAEPANVRTYFEAAKVSVNALLKNIFNKDLQEILLADAIKDEAIKEHFTVACTAIENKDYFNALIAIRKAMYVGVEADYSVYGWRDIPQGTVIGILNVYSIGGYKAPWHTKNKEWIDKNILDPFGYIQIDHESLRIDLLEWGVSTQDFWNIWRLTPQVFYNRDTKLWQVSLDLQHAKGGATEQNSRYCLDRAISLLIKKKNHFDLSKQLDYSSEYRFNIKMKSAQPLFSKASTNSVVTLILENEAIYSADGIVPGLSEDIEFVKVSHTLDIAPHFIRGYVRFDCCEIIQ